MSKLLLVFFMSRKVEQDSMGPHICMLSKYANVLCVEPPASYFPIGKKIYNQPVGKVKKVDANLYVFQPRFLIPYTLTLVFPVLARINNLLLRKPLNNIVRQLHPDQVVVSIRHPGHWGIINLIDYDLLCYELTDNWHAYPGLNRFYSKLLCCMENNLLNKADIVFATSKEFLEYKGISLERGFVLHNGAEVDRFIEGEKSELPSDLQAIPSPRVGLIGHLTRCVDFQLLFDIAKENPNWSLVLIGENNISGFWSKEKHQMKKLLKLPNVYYLGLKQYETLPAYLKGLDVCLMPYQINEYNRFVYPNKVHQYLAGGKPVVSTDMFVMGMFKDVIYLARTGKEFKEMVKESLLKPITPEILTKYRNVAKNHSLDKRARLFIEIIQKHLS